METIRKEDKYEISHHGFTYRQQKIIDNGEEALRGAGLERLNSIHRKAKELGYPGIATVCEEEIAKRKRPKSKVILEFDICSDDRKDGFTPNQARLIKDGTSALKNTSHNVLQSIYIKAKNMGYDEIAQQCETHLLYGGVHPPKQHKAKQSKPLFSDRELSIIDGSVPLDKVKCIDLARLYSKLCKHQKEKEAETVLAMLKQKDTAQLYKDILY